MSWTNELYNVYEQQCGIEHNDGTVLLPVAHSTANAQIEVILKPDGAFVSARTLTKEEGRNTIIPVTMDSGGRTSGICAMPFADKLIYLCGDYSVFTDKDNSAYFKAYIEQLGIWNESSFSHPSVKAVYNYISRKTLMHDLIDCHVLETDEKKQKLSDNVKIADVMQKDAFVRFRVYGNIQETWLDKSLYEAFIGWNMSELKDKELCYATGEVSPITYKHPAKIRNTGDKAKLISANDETGFTYRGRFNDKTEAISVSYDFSQKMHNALRWLIERQGIRFDTLTLTVWTSSLSPPPNIMDSPIDPDDDEYFDEENTPDIGSVYRDKLRKFIYGTKEPDIDSKVMIMGVDAATTGRLSISVYEELQHSRILEQLITWHSETASLRKKHGSRKWYLNSFSVLDIIRCAYGTENDSGSLEVKPEIVKENILRLIPCVTQGRKLPSDIVGAIVRKSSNPLTYDEKYHNHRKVLETACGMIRKYNIDRMKGVNCMAYDKNETDRSYLFGCLLAVADAAEYAAYEKVDKEKRVTNARRLWNRFVSRPSTTWAELENKLLPYMSKLGAKGLRYKKMTDEIMSRFDITAFSDNSPLKPAYLLGYHHFNAEIYRSKTDEEDNNNA